MLALTINASARKFDNLCGVVSQFTPNNDSVVYGYVNTTFTNTSINATSVTWYVNGFNSGTGNTKVIWFDVPGTYEVMLVAKNGPCYDTSVCYYINPGTQPPNRDNIKAFYGFPLKEEKVTGMVATYDGGYLLAGTTTLYSQTIQPPYHGESGILIKISSSGCVEWTKLMKSTFLGTIKAVFALPDSTYGIIGRDDFHYIRVLDASGNLKWNRNFQKNGNYLEWNCMSQSADKGYILAGQAWGNGLYITKLDANGSMVWCRFQYKENTTYFNYLNPSLVVKENDIYIAATASQSAYMVPADTNTVLLKMDATTGQTRWAKTYTLNGANVYVRNLENRGTGLILNTTTLNADNNILYLDTAGTILDSRTIHAPGLNTNTVTSHVKVRANGDLYLLNQGSSPLSLQPYITYKANTILLDKNFNVKWSRIYGGAGWGRFYYHAIGKDGVFATIGEESNAAIPAHSYGMKMMLKKMDTLSPINVFTGCGFGDYPLTVVPSTAIMQNFIKARDSAYTMQVLDTSASILTSYAQVRYTCPTQFIDSCSFVAVTGPAAICNIAATYTYKLHRNKACNQPLTWQVKPTANIISQSDTSITIRFPAFGNYSVAALLPFACTPVKDSVLISVVSNSPPLSLGPDTALCPGNTMLADAGPRFYSYEWQDGSTARTYAIAAPGTYWVKATDSCGNIFRDTLQVAQTAAVAINGGPDRNKCNNDTLHLNAPAGFINYAWSPNYNINSLNGISVVVNPAADTSYILKAEKTPGCFAMDTIRITVFHSPAIQLGPDTSLCAGQSIMVSAGSGFANYQWSNGGTGMQNTFNAAATYTVTGTTAQGCTSYDTVRILNVYPLPNVGLNHNHELCTGITRTLDAGAFATYRWQDGSAGRTYTAQGVGTYYVQVTDSHGCTGTDTSTITTLLPLPNNFLPADTAICQYETLTLQPLKTYASYLWSTNSILPTAMATTAGTYWLQVRDNKGCTGADSITLRAKECLKGLFVPSAFTPNNDGKNDRLKALLFGGVKKYEFSMYNRFGQLVFHTKDAAAGWDGRIKGEPQTAGVYVWICTYQLNGEQPKTERGTAVLIR